ncbi:MAG: lipid-A-disaccharide synthase [Pseudomonadota bacterium]|jgi:lipid-A-disaccharide synthase
MQLGMVAGELSGDLLGVGLLKALQQQNPDSFHSTGIGGPNMIAAGLHSQFPLETLSVMGLVEVLAHYWEIKRCFNQLHASFLAQPPDVFIGIDAPDFNLPLERLLKQANIPSVHYVSPSVWAWRQYRVKRIAKSCDLMLTLFPFEAEYYQQQKIHVHFVGHPLADEIPFENDTVAARRNLGIAEMGQWVALLPGSRQMEVKQLTHIFLQAAQWLHAKQPHLQFILPVAQAKLRPTIEQCIAEFAPELPITVVDGKSREVMAAADVVLITSGTATLEAMLLKRPMVVAYRAAQLTYWIIKPFVKIPYFSLPNLLAREALVPEFLQQAVTPENLGVAVLNWLQHPEEVQVLQARFMELHQELRKNASEQAARAIMELLR